VECDEDGVWVPDAAVEAGWEDALGDIVWLSRVSRRDVMMTCGIW
jgi:hypothetical protein